MILMFYTILVSCVLYNASANEKRAKRETDIFDMTRLTKLSALQ